VNAPAYEIPPLPIEAPPLYTRRGGEGGIPNNQWVWRFQNGYGASVVQGYGTYGHEAGLYELGVIKFNGDGDRDWRLTYKTPVTDDVIGWLSVEQVAEKLAEIAGLPAEGESR